MLDPFLPLRDAALQAAEGPQLANELEAAWSNLHGGQSSGGSPSPEVAHLLLTEITVFPAAVEIAEAQEKVSKEPLLNKKRLLGIGKTALDSIRDVLDAQPLARGALRVLSEIFGIFRED